MANDILAWNGSNWTTNPKRIYGWNGSTWATDIQKVYAWNGSAWVQIWTLSDPITITVNPTWCCTFGESHQERAQYTMTPLDASLYQGDWDSVGHPSGMQRVYGVMRFDSAAIVAAAGGRTVCSVMTLRLTTRAAYSGSGVIPSIWTSGVDPGSSAPSTLPSLGSFENQKIGVRADVGVTQTLTFPDAVGSSMIVGGEKTLIAYNSGTSEAAKVDYRGVFYGTVDSSGVRPLLSITCDYV